VSAADREAFRCPTCRALQEWSDTCRRCKCDLRLLRDVAESYRRTRRRCLLALRSGQAPEALRAARACRRLRDDDESRRLVALSLLLASDWPAAAAMAQDLVEEDDRPPVVT
jgi:hypothetical protein